jgi:hypothetical protein
MQRFLTREILPWYRVVRVHRVYMLWLHEFGIPRAVWKAIWKEFLAVNRICLGLEYEGWDPREQLPGVQARYDALILKIPKKLRDTLSIYVTPDVTSDVERIFARLGRIQRRHQRGQTSMSQPTYARLLVGYLDLLLARDGHLQIVAPTLRAKIKTLQETIGGRTG